MLSFNPLAAALACALFYGCSTYLGGRASVHIGVAHAVSLFQAGGLALVISLLILVPQSGDLRRVDAADLLLASASGICFAVGWAFLGQGLAAGYTTIVAPVECITSVAFCAIAESLMVGWPAPALIGGIALAGGAAALISLGSRGVPRSSRAAGRSVRFGVSAGLAFGMSYVTIGFISADVPLLSLAVMRFFAASGTLAWLAMQGRSSSAGRALRAVAPGPWTRGPACALAGGVLDGLGSFAFVVATLNGLVGISVAVLSLYAAVTVLLGMLLLNESLSRLQVVGLACGAGAVVMLAR